MKLKHPHCPICKGLANATLEVVEGFALMTVEESGEADYFGETEVDWESQRTKTVGNSVVTLRCDEAHQWPSGIEW